MSKKWSSIFVIIITVVCVMIMILSNNNTDNIRKKDKINVINTVPLEKEEKNKKIQQSDLEYLKKYKIPKKHMGNTIYSDYSMYSSKSYKDYKLDEMHRQNLEDRDDYYVSIHKEIKELKETKEIVPEYDDTDEFSALRMAKLHIIDNTSINDSEEKKVNNYDMKNENDETTATVFKVDVNDIEDSLTVADKAKLLSVAIKLAPVDYARVEEYLNSDDGETGVIKALKLLKERLDSKDYQKIRDIANKFLYMDVVENSDE